MGVGALRVFNDDRLQPGAVWPLHPHRDIESCTYVVEGLFPMTTRSATTAS
jgi:redox-sensitive bicupin YhaK (pirin superfamily)